MTSYAVYKTETGELVSMGTVAPDVEALSAKGLSVSTYEQTEMLWNTETRAFDIAPPAPKMPPISRLEFMRRFTQPERTAIRKSVNDVVIDFYDLTKRSTEIDLTAKDVVNGLVYLESENILQAGRANEVLNG